MNLSELEKRKSMLLAELSTETICDDQSSTSKEITNHVKSCDKCQMKRELGKQYESIRKQIKQLQGRSNQIIAVDSNTVRKEYAEWRKVAERNGIKARTFRSRVSAGMTYEEAANTPMFGKKPRRKELPEKLLKQAEANGISKRLLHYRLEKGWSEEDAVRPKKGQVDKEFVELAAKNGISKGTFRNRINAYGMTPLEAATRPLGPNGGKRK